MNLLFIDTSDSMETIIKLRIGTKNIELKEVSKGRRFQSVLLLIDKILTENNLTPKDLDAIEVNEGPGSFTGIRVGVSIANTLSLCLDVPLNSKANHLVAPIYA